MRVRDPARARLHGARLLVPVLLAILVGSCDASPVLFPDAASVEVAGSPDQLRGVAGEVLLPAPELRIVDGSGNPVPGARVSVQVTEGGGSIGSGTRISDRSGIVSLSGWTLGEAAGPNALEVQVEGRGSAGAGSGSPSRVVTALGEAGPPSRIEPAVEGALRGPVGQPLEAAIRVRVLDRFDNPVPARDVNFEPLEGGGTVSTSSLATDAGGFAGPVAWTLGSTAGLQGLRVAATGVSGVATTLEAEAEPGPPAELRLEGTPPSEGTVGEVVDMTLDARVLDAFGNGIAGVEVSFTPASGSGSVSESVGSTGGDGRAALPSWTLGTEAGPQLLVVASGELPPVELGLVARAGPPASLVALTDTSFVAFPGEVVEPAPAVRVRDAFGNPVPGARVDFTGHGTITGGEAVTDASGRAVLGSWQLRATAGEDRLEAALVPAVGGVNPVVFRAQVVAPPFLLSIQSGQDQAAPAGAALPNPVVVRLETEGGAPAPGEILTLAVVEGGGFVSSSTVVTGADGRANITGWTLGPEPGPNRLRVQGTQSNPVTVRATAEVPPDPEPSAYRVDAAHLNQGSQTFLGEIALVAGRSGLFRVFMSGTEPSPPGVRVRVRLRHGSTVVFDEVVGRAGNGGITTGTPNLSSLEASWNLQLPGALVQPGLSMRVDVDPDGVLGLPPGSVSWPVEGDWVTPVVVELPTFRSTFIPVYVEDYDLTGRITPSNVGDYTAFTLDAFPIGASDFEVRTTPLVYDGSFQNPNDGWIGVLQDIRDLRLAEGALSRYYHGILQRPSGPGIAGIAYVATQPLGIQNLAAVSFDALPTAGPVIAHEFGHNFGRYHAPCGVGSGLDGAYPYPDGGLGFPGYSAASGELRLDGPFRDVMSYCFPLWPSDYTYESILMMRDARPVGAPPAPAWAVLGDAPIASTRGILVGGGWSGAGGAPFLRPGISVTAPATPASPGGEVQVRIEDEDGGILFDGRFEGAPVDHADDAELRHFGVVVPVPEGNRPARIVVTTPAGQVTRAVTAPSVDPLVTVTVADAPVRLPGEADTAAPALRITWDAEAWPVLVVRHEGSDEIVGFLRTGDARIPLPPGPTAAPAISGLAPGASLDASELRAFGIVIGLSDGVTTRELPGAR